MNDLIAVAKECGATVSEHGDDFYTVQFGEASFPAFAERIRVETLVEASRKIDAMVNAIDHGGNVYRRPASAEHCAAILRTMQGKA